MYELIKLCLTNFWAFLAAIFLIATFFEGVADVVKAARDAKKAAV